MHTRTRQTLSLYIFYRSDHLSNTYATYQHQIQLQQQYQQQLLHEQQQRQQYEYQQQLLQQQQHMSGYDGSYFGAQPVHRQAINPTTVIGSSGTVGEDQSASGWGWDHASATNQAAGSRSESFSYFHNTSSLRPVKEYQQFQQPAHFTGELLSASGQFHQVSVQMPTLTEQSRSQSYAQVVQAPNPNQSAAVSTPAAATGHGQHHHSSLSASANPTAATFSYYSDSGDWRQNYARPQQSNVSGGKFLTTSGGPVHSSQTVQTAPTLTRPSRPSYANIVGNPTAQISVAAEHIPQARNESDVVHRETSLQLAPANPTSTAESFSHHPTGSRPNLRHRSQQQHQSFASVVQHPRAPTFASARTEHPQRNEPILMPRIPQQ